VTSVLDRHRTLVAASKMRNPQNEEIQKEGGVVQGFYTVNQLLVFTAARSEMSDVKETAKWTGVLHHLTTGVRKTPTGLDYVDK
jgi:hypothetical protein